MPHVRKKELVKHEMISFLCKVEKKALVSCPSKLTISMPLMSRNVIERDITRGGKTTAESECLLAGQHTRLGNSFLGCFLAGKLFRHVALLGSFPAGPAWVFEWRNLELTTSKNADFNSAHRTQNRLLSVESRAVLLPPL